MSYNTRTLIWSAINNALGLIMLNICPHSFSPMMMRSWRQVSRVKPHKPHLPVGLMETCTTLAVDGNRAFLGGELFQELPCNFDLFEVDFCHIIIERKQDQSVSQPQSHLKLDIFV